MRSLALLLLLPVALITAQEQPAFTAVLEGEVPVADITSRCVVADGVYVTRGSGESSSVWFINGAGATRVELAGASELWDFHAPCSFWTGNTMSGAWASVMTDDGPRVFSLAGGKAELVTLPDGRPLTEVRMRAASEKTCAVATREDGADRIWRLHGPRATAVSLETRHSRGAIRLIAAGERLMLFTREQNSPDGDNRRVLVTHGDTFKPIMNGDQPVRDEPVALDGSMGFEVARLGTGLLWRGGESDALLTLPVDTHVVNAVVRDGKAWADFALSAARRRVAREVDGRLVEFKRGENQPLISESLFVAERVFSCGVGRCWEQMADGTRRVLEMDPEATPYLQYAATGETVLVTGYQYLAPAVFVLRDGRLVAQELPFEGKPKKHFPAVTGEGAYLFATDDTKFWRLYRMAI